MAGTSMLTNITIRDFDDSILRRFGLNREIFSALAEPGAAAGYLKRGAASEIGLKEGIPVVASGHDTQFAVFGAGAGPDEPILSSGTWEILMARIKAVDMKQPASTAGVSIELDAEKGLLNPSVQWVASGILEWIGELFFSSLGADSSRYDIMIDEAGKIGAGCDGVRILPELFPGGGLTQRHGIIEGLNNKITRGHIYRSALEALAIYTRYGLCKLENSAGFTAASILCVGGGSKNRLWDQIRADVLGIQVKTNERKETTALGAACFAMAALGWYKSPSDASAAMGGSVETFYPGKDAGTYEKIYNDYIGNYFSSG
jgi:L-fuculokinase